MRGGSVARLAGAALCVCALLVLLLLRGEEHARDSARGGGGSGGGGGDAGFVHVRVEHQVHASAAKAAAPWRVQSNVEVDHRGGPATTTTVASATITTPVPTTPAALTTPAPPAATSAPTTPPPPPVPTTPVPTTPAPPPTKPPPTPAPPAPTPTDGSASPLNLGWRMPSPNKAMLPAAVNLTADIRPLPLPDVSSCAAAHAQLTIDGANWTALAAPPCPAMVRRVVFYKTHKTASTTVSSVLFRLGVRHGLRFLVAPHYLQFGAWNAWKQPSDISLYHHNTFPGGLNFTDMALWYRNKIPTAHFLTIFRDPVKRALSEWYYFHEPNGRLQLTLADALKPNMTRPGWRTLTTDLGIYTQAALDYYLREGHALFPLIIVVERMDESLVLLKRMFGWALEDLLYLPLLEACADGERWDGRRVRCSSQVQQPPELLARMREALWADYAIYDLARARVEALLAQQPADFWDEVSLFRRTRTELDTLCAPHFRTVRGRPALALNTTAAAVPARCLPYVLTDLQFEEIIKNTAGAPTPAAVDAAARQQLGM